MLTRKNEFLKYAETLLQWFMAVGVDHDLYGMLDDMPRAPHYQVSLDGRLNTITVKAYQQDLIHKESRSLLADPYDINGQRLRSVGTTAAAISRQLDEACPHYTSISHILTELVAGNRLTFYFNTTTQHTCWSVTLYQGTPSGRPLGNLVVEVPHTSIELDEDDSAYLQWLEDEATLEDLFAQCHREGGGHDRQVGFYTLNDLRCVSLHTETMIRKPYLYPFIAFTGISLNTGQHVPGLAITRNGHDWTYIIRTVTSEYQPLTLMFTDARWTQTQHCDVADVERQLKVKHQLESA